MRTGIYSDRIRRIIEVFPAGEPFTNEMISELLQKDFGLTKNNAERITNNKLKRMFDEGTIGRIEKGVYYVSKQTVFGQIKPDYSRYAIDVLTKNKDDIIGYESGASFLNRIGLSTLIPREIEVATNNYRRKLPENCHITVKKPPVVVTNENFRYLQILDAINNLNKLPIDAESPNEILNSVITTNDLEAIKLVGYARKYYPRRILPEVIDIIVGDDLV